MLEGLAGAREVIPKHEGNKPLWLGRSLVTRFACLIVTLSGGPGTGASSSTLQGRSTRTEFSTGSPFWGTPWRKPVAPTPPSSTTAANPASTCAAAGCSTCCWEKPESFIRQQAAGDRRATAGGRR